MRANTDFPSGSSVGAAGAGVSPAQEEFEALLGLSLGAAMSLAMSLARGREDAEDLVQNAAVRAFAGFGRFQKGTNFKAWFLRVLWNQFLHHHRDAGRRPQTTSLDEEALPEWSLHAQALRSPELRSEGDPAAALVARLDAQEVRRAFASLPEDFRVVSLLYFVEDFSYQEIADIVGCPVGTVRSRLHRSRKLLQRALWEMARESGVVSGTSASGTSAKRKPTR